MKLASNSIYHQRSKHIDTKFYRIRDKVQNKMAHMQYVTAALLTKVIDGVLFHKHLTYLVVDIVI